MSIICYTGLPGDGKSYSAVENVVIPALKAGRIVAHNLMLNPVVLSVVCDRDVSPLLVQLGRDDTADEIVRKCPPGAVIVLDEVWRYWPGGTKANEVPKEELKFFKEHRHRVGLDGLCSEILIIDQDPKTGVPAFLRALIELTYLHTKHSKIGAKGRFRVDVYARAQPADRPAKGALIRSLQGRYRPEVWNCYVSHTQSQRIGEAGLEQIVDDRANILKGWTVRFALAAAVALPFAIWFAISTVNGFSRGRASTHASDEGAAAATQPAVPPSPALLRPAPQSGPDRLAPALVTVPPGESPPMLAPVKYPESKQWRYAGVIDVKGRKRYVVDGDAGSMYVAASDCHRDRVGNVSCVLDGELINPFTGPAPPSVQTVLQVADPILGGNPS